MNGLNVNAPNVNGPNVMGIERCAIGVAAVPTRTPLNEQVGERKP